MAINYFLAPNARYQGRDQTGNPVVMGKLYTYDNLTSNPKATFQDPEGMVTNTNPVILDAKGEANIYWADDNLYSIRLVDQNDQQVYTQDNYPTVGNNQSVPIIPTFQHNLVRNPQFTFWYNGTSFPAISSTPANNYDFVADDWLFSKTDTTSTVNISKELFSLGQTSVPGSPVSFLRYECTDIGSGTETNSHLYQRYESVQTLANRTVTVAIWARCQVIPSCTLTIVLSQNFGTGGSPSAQQDTIVLTATLSNSFNLFTATITLPDINGATLGSNGDDALLLSIKYPSNQTGKIDANAAILIDGSNPISTFYDYISQNDQELKLYRNKTEWFTTGDFKHSLKTVADPSWVNCNYSTIGNAASGADNAGLYSKALFKLLWANVGSTYAPLLDSMGAPIAYGSSSEQDFNANKRMIFPPALGRVLAGANPTDQGILKKYFTAAGVNLGSNYIAIDDASSFYTGTHAQVVGADLPAPLVTETYYYIVNLGSNHIQFATTLANAQAGTVITLTTTGSGTNIVGIAGTTYAYGATSGEYLHAPLIAEMASHNHPGSTVPALDGGASATANGALQGDVPSDTIPLTIASQGGGNPFNITQPTLFVNIMIKL